MPQDAEKTKKKRTWHWLLWWIVDPSELVTELDRYPDRNPFKTARGISAAFLLLSVVLTLAMILFKVLPVGSSIDAVISLILVIFIYFGHRWAMLAAMAWWSLEKAMMVIDGDLPAAQIIWWCIYMHAFWLAFRVEQTRRKPPEAVAAVITTD